MSLLCRQVWNTLRCQLWLLCICRTFTYLWTTLFCFKLRNAISTASEFYLSRAYSLILRAQPHSKMFLHSWEKALFCSLKLQKRSAFVFSLSSSLSFANYWSFCIFDRASARFYLFWSLNSSTFTFKSRFCSLRVPISYWEACSFSWRSVKACLATKSAALLSWISEKSAKCSACVFTWIFLLSPNVW